MHHYIEVIVDGRSMGTLAAKDIDRKLGKLRHRAGVKFVDKWLSDAQVEQMKAEGRRQKAEGRRQKAEGNNLTSSERK
ncbi:MAG: hypothetical protein AB9919_02215 [Geobacteraceae bacterium]